MIIRSGYATFMRNWTITLRAYPWSFFIGSLLAGSLTVLLSYFLYHLLAGGQLSSQFTTYTGTSDYMSYIILGAATLDRKSTRLNSSHYSRSRMPSSA